MRALALSVPALSCLGQPWSQCDDADDHVALLQLRGKYELAGEVGLPSAALQAPSPRVAAADVRHLGPLSLLAATDEAVQISHYAPPPPAADSPSKPVLGTTQTGVRLWGAEMVAAAAKQNGATSGFADGLAPGLLVVSGLLMVALSVSCCMPLDRMRSAPADVNPPDVRFPSARRAPERTEEAAVFLPAEATVPSQPGSGSVGGLSPPGGSSASPMRVPLTPSSEAALDGLQQQATWTVVDSSSNAGSSQYDPSQPRQVPSLSQNLGLVVAGGVRPDSGGLQRKASNVPAQGSDDDID